DPAGVAAAEALGHSVALALSAFDGVQPRNLVWHVAPRPLVCTALHGLHGWSAWGVVESALEAVLGYSAVYASWYATSARAGRERFLLEYQSLGVFHVAWYAPLWREAVERGAIVPTSFAGRRATRPPRPTFCVPCAGARFADLADP